MSKLTAEQVRLRHRGREFHFVCYRGQAEDRKRNVAATEPTWFLMRAGKRWEVMPQLPDQQEGERDRLLTAWLEQHVFQPTV